MDILIERIMNAFELTKDLVEHLDEKHLRLKLKDLPSNSIGEQIWCIIGARESYFKALQMGSWQGFSCSLSNAYSKKHIINSLDATQATFKDYFTKHQITTQHIEWLFLCLEHEIQHHGQLIRYIYGHRLTFPNRWHSRYTV